jgi:hypothetical protein
MPIKIISNWKARTILHKRGVDASNDFFNKHTQEMRKSCKIGTEGVKEAIKGTRHGMYKYEIEAVARFIDSAEGDGR